MANRQALAPSLLQVARDAGVEYWWYPLWANHFGEYTDGYIPDNLCIAPQSSLKDHDGVRWHYFRPDFMIVQLPQAGGRILRLVMEAKKDQTVEAMAEAQLEAEFYINLAINQTNSPIQAGFTRIFAVATAGAVWQWTVFTRQQQQQPGGAYTNWDNPNGWSNQLGVINDAFGAYMEL